MSDFNTPYKKDQKIVYPSQGVGTIQDIKEKKFKDQMILYYVIYLDVSDMTIMIPVEKSDELGIRPIVSKEEALKAIEMIGQEFEPITSDWKLRYQMNLDKLKQGSINDIASIVRCLYHRSKVKELPILERKLYDSAKKLLEDEIAYSLEKTNKEVEAMIHAKLEPLGLMHAKTQSSFAKDFGDEDDEEFSDLNEDSEDENDEEDDDDDMMDDDDE